MNTTKRILQIVVIPILLLLIGFMFGQTSAPEPDSGLRAADVARAYQQGFDEGYQQAVSETLTETSDLLTELATLFSKDPKPGMLHGVVVDYRDEGSTLCLNLEDTDGVACGPIDVFNIKSSVGAPVGASVLIQEGPDHTYILSVWGETE